MKTAVNVVKFPSKEKGKAAPAHKKRVHKSVDKIKYFNTQQIKILRRAAREQAELDVQHGRIAGIREWMIIDLLTCTGLRVSEAANMKCGDLKIGYADNRIYVRHGKGDISGHIVINESLKKHLRNYLKWKVDRNEGTADEDYIFIGQRGKWTSQAVQQIIKKYLKDLNLYERGKSVHALRHSYAVELYSKGKDLRMVQKQLRHVSIQSTLVYADVTDEAIGEQVKGLWN